MQLFEAHQDLSEWQCYDCDEQFIELQGGEEVTMYIGDKQVTEIAKPGFMILGAENTVIYQVKTTADDN